MERKKESKGEKREDPKKSRPRRVVVLGFGGVGSRKGRAPRSGRTAGAGTTTRHLHLDASHHPPRERQGKRAMMPSWRQLIQSRLTWKTRQQPKNARPKTEFECYERKSRLNVTAEPGLKDLTGFVGGKLGYLRNLG